MIFFFLMVVRYIRIKQQCIKVKVVKILKKNQADFSTLKTTSGISHSRQTSFKRINAKMLSIYEEIKGQNQYWSKFITIYFAVYIMEICYLSYAFFFVPISEITFSKYFFGFFSAEFTLLLLYVTLECSRVVSLNVQMYRDCLKMALEYTRKAGIGVVLGGNSRSKRKVRLLAELLQLDNMAANSQNVNRICFKWTNNYRINSQMFELVS